MKLTRVISAAFAALIVLVSTVGGASFVSPTTASWNDAQSADAGLTSFTELYVSWGVNATIPWRPGHTFDMYTAGGVTFGANYFPFMDSNNVVSSATTHLVSNSSMSNMDLVIDDWVPDFRTEDNFDLVVWLIEVPSDVTNCRNYGQENFNSVGEILDSNHPHAIMRATNQGEDVEVFKEIVVPPGETFAACRYYEIRDNLENFTDTHASMTFGGTPSQESIKHLEATYRYNNDWYEEG